MIVIIINGRGGEGEVKSLWAKALRTAA
jgi:hypothetical protein